MIFNILALEVTKACMNRCKYCYAKGKPISSNMSDETLIQSLQIMDSQPISNFNISLLGGEPSLRLHKIIPIILDFKNNTEKKISLSLNTNGLIFNQELCDLIKPLSPSLAISLDGPKEIHDFNRVDIKGRGTYDKLINNIPLLLKNFPDAFCQATFTPETINKLSDSYFLAKNLGFKEWYWAPDLYNSIWTDNDYEIMQKQLNIIAKDYFNQNKILYRGFEEDPSRNKGNNRFKSDSHCLLVETDGKLKISRLNASCLSQHEDSYWYIGQASSGLDFKKIQEWEQRYCENADTLYYAYNTNDICKTCPANYICYNSSHKSTNSFLFKIQCQQPRMQCEQKRAILSAIQNYRL